MTLAELVFATFVFSRLDNGAYDGLLEKTGDYIDLSLLDHRLAIIKWLSKYGVRGIATEHHDIMSEQIRIWHENNELFDHNRNLSELGDDDLVLISNAYENLMQIEHIGPTGAAKLLFAVRPKALMMWDEPIRRELEYGEEGQSYIDFLRWVQVKIREIERLCENHNFELNDLSDKLGRPNSTIPKLIDEYLWVTITRGFRPSEADFQRWAEWS